ncbi:uncharacterized protein SPPG_08939 [Spizellomyces punctatus DAOM BR117]|uniref:Uncharacterized protein n=1 Tax=Spizellomyces punctatus (strain DAOM BR117) TaxID=645134 RepID=A0A0L0HT34_SPIPD|nr:uncharacterized protein SPPG_08939 [Spizellomyces punctatus DAOM BR117]KND04055.1 hypothetical protein SPPG_08939 [Spizellomyces punctatus DAOM BR117]|eukprot:XP_016612094.1 hypothetical protein SPPG_08939 [Spizellomyces punctatus DAOM BR117]
MSRLFGSITTTFSAVRQAGKFFSMYCAFTSSSKLFADFLAPRFPYLSASGCFRYTDTEVPSVVIEPSNCILRRDRKALVRRLQTRNHKSTFSTASASWRVMQRMWA